MSDSAGPVWDVLRCGGVESTAVEARHGGTHSCGIWRQENQFSVSHGYNKEFESSWAK